METMRFFAETASKLFNPQIEAWKSTGKPVIGITCTSIPEEILYAAGLLPIRLRAYDLPDTGMADSEMHRIVCSYSRAILNLQLAGDLDFLDGLVVTNTCDHHLRLAGQLKDKSDYSFFHYFSMYHTLTDGGKEWYRAETEKMIQQIEGTFGTRISEENLRQTISVYNRSRQLLKRLNELRKNNPAPLSGAEYLQVITAGMSMPKEIFNKHLEHLLNQLEEKQIGQGGDPRILIRGGACDSPAFVSFVESKGASVVADDSCFGLRYVQGIMDNGAADPLNTIVDRYFNRVQCPSVIDGFSQSLAHINAVIDEWNIQGIVNARVKFCDHWAGAGWMLKNSLTEMDKKVPVLDLEREYHTEGSGQISTRLQAFLELI